MLSKPYCMIALAILLSSLQSKGEPDNVQHLPELKKLHTEEITSAYPNPFSANTTIFYMAKENAFVRVKLFNNQGGFMGDIYDDVVEKGSTYQFELDGSRMIPGVYFYTIETEKSVLHRRIELVR